MIIDILSDNITLSSEYGSEHGLSIHITSGHQKILFDTGAGSLFLENAIKLKIDISKVDLAVISHGHSDHGGGLSAFLENNDKASVYISQHAFGSHYSNKASGIYEEIGLDQSLALSKKLVLTSGLHKLNEHVVLFPCNDTHAASTDINRNLFKRIDDKYVSDDFLHEQNMAITEGGKSVLITGCAHAGIINIIESFKDIFDRYPQYVIGGFHLYNRNYDNKEDILSLEDMGRFFKMTGSEFYTCHCTGLLAYKRLKEILGKRIRYLPAGKRLKI